MHCHTYQVFAASYNTMDAAMADFSAVEAMYGDMALVDTYDAIVLAHEKGKAGIVRDGEQADGRDGVGIGLALGACCALFPAVTLANGAVAGAIARGAVAIVAGHFVSGVSRDALRDLGQVLDEGTFGLIVIVATDVAQSVRDAIKRAVSMERQPFSADCKAIRKELRQLGEA